MRRSRGNSHSQPNIRLIVLGLTSILFGGTASQKVNPESECQDVIGWTDNYGDTCATYTTNNYCTAQGNYGNGWQEELGTFQNYSWGGLDATTACCGCGGGIQVPIDGECHNLGGWSDASDEGCVVYAVYDYCTSDKEAGPGWDTEVFGSINDWSYNGVSAFDACCVCGGGSTAQVTIPAASTTSISTAENQIAAQESTVCVDKAGWADSYGDTCLVYSANNYCSSTGGFGSGWDAGWGSLEDYTHDGDDATTACCDCGGGNQVSAEDAAQCYDVANWVDAGGEGCDIYSSNRYCRKNGNIGNGWDAATYGTIEDWAWNSLSALTACCACGGGSPVLVTIAGSSTSSTSSTTTTTSTTTTSADPQTLTPTSAPASSSPTSLPSQSPTTLRPTFGPTKLPIAAPISTSPTSQPSMSEPTSDPTKLPTANPVALPTATPISSSPTSLPSQSPTTLRPTFGPTKLPTAAPISTSPTSQPSMSEPTPDPTKLPTVSPVSSAPSGQPSTLPTMVPISSTPTSQPSTSKPTPPPGSPTISPSLSPSKSPTFSPSVSPSKSPTFSPSVSPSKSPIFSPSVSPSKSPIFSPSTSPSKSPTFLPSTPPSTQHPTKIPSSSPSNSPTLSPSIIPTWLPSYQPSLNPSRAPSSNAPTQHPTQTPTHQPSLAPTNYVFEEQFLFDADQTKRCNKDNLTSLAPNWRMRRDTIEACALSCYKQYECRSATFSVLGYCHMFIECSDKVASTGVVTIHRIHKPTTFSPTMTPSTHEPTTSPTAPIPTLMPSTAPPSSIPSVSPTVLPTISPTISLPTLSPHSSIPTEYPTSSNPTGMPSVLPTTVPTISAPSNSPSTLYPTAVPTMTGTLPVVTLYIPADFYQLDDYAQSRLRTALIASYAQNANISKSDIISVTLTFESSEHYESRQRKSHATVIIAMMVFKLDPATALQIYQEAERITKEQLTIRFAYGTTMSEVNVTNAVSSNTEQAQLEGSVCVNYPIDWADKSGERCDVYADLRYCSLDGTESLGWNSNWGFLTDYPDEHGILATFACCACGGGVTVDITDIMSNTPALASCQDFPGWIDNLGDTCATYLIQQYCTANGSTSDGWYAEWGEISEYKSADGLTALDACCACGGGTKSLTTLTPLDECSDVPRDWRTVGDQLSCKDFEERTLCTAAGGIGRGWNYSWGGDLTDKVSIDGLSAAEVCCACGGPKNRSQVPQQGTCRNAPFDWQDQAGDSCSDYRRNEFCIESGEVGPGWSAAWGGINQYRSGDDIPATLACCTCGGGETVTDEELAAEYNNIIAPGCVDRSNWTNTRGDNCYDYFINGYCNGTAKPGIGWSDSFGPIELYADLSGTTALDACCICGGGGNHAAPEPISPPIIMCMDLPFMWKDSGGDTCAVYETYAYCTKDGEEGDGWEFDNWGPLDATRGTNGVLAGDACCACGGGRMIDIAAVVAEDQSHYETCTDVDGWSTLLNETCTTYQAFQFCSNNGSSGPGWDSIWGRMTAYTSSTGLSAVDACCYCGGGVRNGELPPTTRSTDMSDSASSADEYLDDIGIMLAVLVPILIGTIVIIVIFKMRKSKSQPLTSKLDERRRTWGKTNMQDQFGEILVEEIDGLPSKSNPLWKAMPSADRDLQWDSSVSQSEPASAFQ